MEISAMRAKLLADLAKYPLCDFFLERSVEAMSDKEVTDDLAAEPDASLLQHFGNPKEMGGLEVLFSRTMEIFGLSKEELEAKAGFNFNVYNIEGFESVRAVFRIANALSEVGFKQFGFLGGTGLADLGATKNGQQWFIEVKTVVLQTKPQVIEFGGKTEPLTVDKFQPASRSIAEYVETVSKLIAGNHIQKARTQLLNTVKQLGAGKKMAAIAVNLFAAPFFLDCANLDEVVARLRGKRSLWEIDYLSEFDALAFLTDHLHLF
jgi:hypothetical protein